MPHDSWQALREYSHALVRVRLPAGLVIQAAFHPQEPVSHILREVHRDHGLQSISARFHL